MQHISITDVVFSYWLYVSTPYKAEGVGVFHKTPLIVEMTELKYVCIRYFSIVSRQVIYLVATFNLTFMDTYILRWRHVLLEWYYPERKRPRAAFVYNHILRRRGTSMRAAFQYVRDLMTRKSNPSIFIDYLAETLVIQLHRSCAYQKNVENKINRHLLVVN